MPYEQKAHHHKINQTFNEREKVLPLSQKNKCTLTNIFHVHIFFLSYPCFFFNGLLAITEMCVFACVWKRDRAYEGAER